MEYIKENYTVSTKALVMKDSLLNRKKGIMESVQTKPKWQDFFAFSFLRSSFSSCVPLSAFFWT